MSPRLIRKIIQKKKLSRIILQIWNNFFQELKIPTPRYQKILWETHYNIGMYSWRLEDWRKSGCIELYSERLEKVLLSLYWEWFYSWRLEYWRKSDCIEMYFGRLIAFWETRKLEKVWTSSYTDIVFLEIGGLEKGWTSIY